MVHYFRALTFASAVLLLLPTVASAQDYVPGEVLVKMKRGTNRNGLQSFMSKSAALKGMSLRRSWSGINMHKFSYNKSSGGAPADVDAVIRELEMDPEVEYAEPNYYIYKQGFEDQQSHKLSYQQFQAYESASSFTQTGASIDAPDAWAIANVTTASDAITVAIIDTGVDRTHTVFTQSGAIWTNPNEVAGNNIDDDGNGYVDDIYGWNFVANNNDPDDDDGHGTHVAGIVLGTTQDIRATPVAAAKIRIMVLKFLDGSGSGTTSDAIEAIYYAANNGARVLNNSWGGGGFSNSLLDAILYAYNKKTLFVAAAGNASNNNDASPTYPANYSMPNLISVAASTDFDNLASFSNYGASSVHMGSPGVSILSTIPNNSFAFSSGTSMATPFVSGVAAMMLREKPTMNGYQIKELIFGSSDAASGLSGRVSTQARLNVYSSVEKAQVTSVDPYMPEYDPNSNVRSTAAAASMQPAGCGMVAKSIWDARGSDGPPGPGRTVAFFGLLLVLIAPVVFSVYLRQKQGKNNRRHTRYQIDSQVRVRFGDRELLGSVSSISLGGVQLNTDAWLDQGGIVKMQIASPDGRDLIEVEGKVVWSEEQKRYGVAFQNAEENALAAISRWTQSLLKTG